MHFCGLPEVDWTRRSRVSVRELACQNAGPGGNAGWIPTAFKVGELTTIMIGNLNFHRSVTYLSRRVRGAAKLASLSVRLRLSGDTIWVDFGDIKLPFHGDGDLQELYYHVFGKRWWKNELHAISPYLAPGDVVIDVGANLGFMSVLFSKLTGPEGRIYSFEPSPLVYAKLSEVIRANHLSNVSPYNLGCGSQEQSMSLYRHRNSGNASLRPDARVDRSTQQHQTVQIIKLDDFLGPKLARLNFIKIDTEGFEDEVLLGAVGLLKRFKPIIYIELSTQYLASSQTSVQLLQDYGYTFDREVDLRRDDFRYVENFIALPPGFSLSAQT
jgi:FkbM family methyltransferase